MADASFDYPAMARALILGQHTVVGEMTRRALAEGIDPNLTQTAVDDYLGTVVIGTAQGDLHDMT